MRMSKKSLTSRSPSTATTKGPGVAQDLEAADMRSGERKKPWLRRTLSFLGWGLFVALVIALWPTALGGPTSFVIVTGKSTEPTLYQGDLVMLRTETYEVGDVVSYQPFQGDSAQVTHRIIEIEDDGTLVLQGDNNGFIDPFAPTKEDVTGKMVLSIPKVGKAAGALGQPLVWGSLLVIAAALLLYKKPERDSDSAELDPLEAHQHSSLNSTERDVESAAADKERDPVTQPTEEVNDQQDGRQTEKVGE